METVIKPQTANPIREDTNNVSLEADLKSTQPVAKPAAAKQILSKSSELADADKATYPCEQVPPIHERLFLASSPILELPAHLAEYVQYSGPACHDPRTCSGVNIRTGIKKIVEIEGPIQVKRVIDIYLRSCGIKRMGHDIEHKMIRAVNDLQHTGELSFDKFRDDQDVLEEIIWLKGSPSISIRRRGDRTLEEIPLNELFYISQTIASRQGIQPYSENHKRAVLEELNLKRLTPNADSILEEAFSIEFEVLAKRCKHDFNGDEWATNFQSDYCHETGGPIEFKVGLVKARDLNSGAQLVNSVSVYIWAMNEFSFLRTKLFGIDNGSGEIIIIGNRFVEILNSKAKKHMVPIDFDNWLNDELHIQEHFTISQEWFRDA